MRLAASRPQKQAATRLPRRRRSRRPRRHPPTQRRPTRQKRARRPPSTSPQGYGPPPQGYGPPPQGYGPPPQGYAPGYGPPQQGYGPPPPPREDPTVNYHDGFYLRLNLGIGGHAITYNDDITAFGGSVALDLLVGGSPNRGLAIGGGLLADYSPNLDLQGSKFL